MEHILIKDYAFQSWPSLMSPMNPKNGQMPFERFSSISNHDHFSARTDQKLPPVIIWNSVPLVLFIDNKQDSRFSRSKQEFFTTLGQIYFTANFSARPFFQRYVAICFSRKIYVLMLHSDFRIRTGSPNFLVLSWIISSPRITKAINSKNLC